MSGTNIPTEVIHKIVNLGGLEKKLLCKNCDGYKNHVSISYGELPGIETGWGRVVGRLFDLVPLVPTLTVGNPFACTVCGQIRTDGGLASDNVNRFNKV